MRFMFCLAFFCYPTFLFCMGKQVEINKILKFFQQESDEEIIRRFNKVDDLNSKIGGFPPLIWAIRCERVGIVEYLVLERKVNVDQVCGFWRETPLHYAVFIGNKKICTILLNAVEFLQEDCWEQTPLDYLRAFPLI